MPVLTAQIHKPPSGAIDEQEVSGETTEMAGVTIPASFDV